MNREEPALSRAQMDSRSARRSGLDAAKSNTRQGALWRWFHLERELWSLALLGWGKRAAVHEAGWVFTHHRQSNWALIAGVLAALTVIEGTAVHLWLQGAGFTLAMWIVLALHVYLLAWILGDAQALRLYPTRLVGLPEGGRVVKLRMGLRGSADIPVGHIAVAMTGTWDEATEGGELLCVSGFANVSLTFDRPIEFVPMLGKPRLVTSLRVQVDEPERFVRAIDQ